jgi:hypothetical protein
MPNCDGTLSLVPNIDRSITDPASRMKFVCDKDDSHVFEDPNTMPPDTSRSITGR